MDAALIINYIKKLNNKPKIKDGKVEEFINFDQFTSFGSIISILIGAYAAYLSYTCNSKRDMTLPTKIVWAIISYFFGLVYIVYYTFFRADYCSQY
jgi:hypothetical protein